MIRFIFQTCVWLLLLVGAQTHAWAKADLTPKIAPWDFLAAAETEPAAAARCNQVAIRVAAFHSYDFAPDVRNGPNLYAYVKQNPWSKFDPHGLHGWADVRSFPHCPPAVRTALDQRDREIANAIAEDFQAVNRWMNANPRIMGGVKTVGGVAEIVVGAGGVAAPTVVSQVAGGAAILHGADTASSGIVQMINGQPTDTLTQQVIEKGAVKVGASPEAAEIIGAVGDAVLGMGATVASARGVLAASARTVEDSVIGYKGIVYNGEIVQQAPIMDATSHARLAEKAGLIVDAPVAGTPGTLVKGAEAFTALREPDAVGGFIVTGSNNFNSQVSSSAAKAVRDSLAAAEEAAKKTQ